MNKIKNKKTIFQVSFLIIVVLFLFSINYLSKLNIKEDSTFLTAALGSKILTPTIIPAEFDVSAGDFTYIKQDGAKCEIPITKCLSKDFLEKYPQIVEAKGRQAQCYNLKMKISADDDIVGVANNAINELQIRLEASKATLAEVSRVTEDDLINGFGVTLIPAGFDDPLDIPGVNSIAYQCISGGTVQKTKDIICGNYTDQYIRIPNFVDLNQNFLNKHKYVSNLIDAYNKKPDGPALDKMKAFMDIDSNKSMLQIVSRDGAVKIPNKIIKKLSPYSGGVTITYDKNNPCTGIGNIPTPKRYIISVSGMNPDTSVCGATGPLKSMSISEIENQIKAFEKRIKNYTSMKVKAEKEKQKILDTAPVYCGLKS